MAKISLVDHVMSLVRKSGPAPTRPIPPKDDRIKIGFEVAPVAIALVAPDGHWLHVNDRFRKLIGYTREELARISFHSITHPDDAKREIAQVKKIVVGDSETFKLEKRIMEKKGTYRTIDVVTTVVRTVSGEPEFFVHVIDEAQSAKRNEGPRDPDRFALTMLDQVAELAIIQTDTRGTISGWNSGAERIFGYKRDEAIGKHRRILYRDPDTWADKPTEQMSMAAETGRLECDDWRVAKNGAHLWVRTAITPFHPEGVLRGYVEVIAVGSGTDTVEAKRALEKLRATSANQSAELQRTIDSLAADMEKGKRTEESLREALEQVRVMGEETMNELKIMAIALRNEMDRRKAAEDELRAANMRTFDAAASFEFEMPLEEETIPLEDDATLIALGATESNLAHVAERAAAPSADTAEPQEWEIEEDDAQFAAPERVWRSLYGATISELLMAAANDQRTGTLAVRSGDREAEIFFDRGRIFSCASNDQTQLLAERLIARGVITEEQRQRALEIREHAQLALGRILLLLGAITEEQLVSEMRTKIRDEVAWILDWKELYYEFVEGEIPALQLVPLRVEVAPLLASIAQQVLAASSKSSEPVVLPVLVSESLVSAFEPVHIEPPPWEPLPSAPGSAPLSLAQIGASDAGVALLEMPVAVLDHVAVAESVVASRSGKAKKYHRPTCVAVRKLSEESRVLFASAAEAAANGFEPCRMCLR